MEYIITEQQYQLIKESNRRVHGIQHLINYIVEGLRRECEKDEEFDEFICDFLYYVENIRVDNVEISDKLTSMGKEKMLLYIIFDYYGTSEPEINEFFDIALRGKLKDMLGTSVYLRYKANQLIKPY
jgi:hypothetical protein